MINFFRKAKTNRYASFTFDDGLINGAKKVDRLIFPHSATFYIVAGWLRPNPLKIEDEPNVGVDHGDFADWKKLAVGGHEIGSHTISHIKPTDRHAEKEYQQSLEFIKGFSAGPYSLAMPYGLKPLCPLLYDSVRLCHGKKIYNPLEKINFLELISFDPLESGLTIENALRKISKLPSNSWLILRAHGLDHEGYCSWPSEYLKKIYESLLVENFEIKTVREMTTEFK